MKQEKVILVGVGIVIGVLIGLVVPKIFTGGGVSQPVAPPEPLEAAKVNYEESISRLKQVLESDPKNYQAWVELGNAYFDSNQPAKAVEAYNRALELDASSPDVHTDMGIMYRALKRYDDAIAEFKKAMSLDPAHLQSRQNLGIIYLYDLKDYKLALQTWEDLMKITPPGERADNLRKQIDGLRQMMAQMGTGAKAPGTVTAPGAASEPGMPPLPPGMGGNP